MCGARLLIEIFRKTEEQYIAHKIEDRFFDHRIPALGGRNSALDYLSILLPHWPAWGEISSINGKAGNRLAHGAGERFEREIAIPAILLRQPVDHVAENIDIVGQRQSHHEQLLRINEMAELQRVPEETMKGLSHRSFGGGIDQQLSHLAREIVASCAVHRPIFRERLAAGKNFLEDHVDGAPILRQRDPKGLRATPLQFFEIFLRQIKTVRMIDA